MQSLPCFVISFSLMARAEYQLGSDHRHAEDVGLRQQAGVQAPIMISIFVFQFTLVNILPSTYTLLAPHYLVCLLS